MPQRIMISTISAKLNPTGDSTVVQSLALSPHNPGFDSGSGRFCVAFACSPCVCVVTLHVLHLPPTVQKHANWGLG